MGDDRGPPDEQTPDSLGSMARFERAWESGESPDIAEFLGSAETPLSVPVLCQCVRSDLTHRWQLATDPAVTCASGATPSDAQPMSLDEYVARFPALASENDRFLELILHEYRVRRMYGSAPDVQTYVRRYGQRFEHLAESLRSIDRQVDDATVEGTVPQRTPGTVGRGSSSRRDDTSRDGGGDTLAHGSNSHADVPSDEKQVGNYILLEEIARGGMGVVYRARQRNLNRLVAVKMILSGEMASSRDVNRFYSEAEAAARLQHPGIIAIHEIGEHNGLPYFSMELVEGPSLDDIIRDQATTCRKAAEQLRDVADAIHYAHEHGVLHRDLKPSNILLDQDGHPKVADFGLAKRVGGDSNLTASGTVLGTPAFMPPEQALGRSERIDQRSDIYSLGAILYALLTGRPPFGAESASATLLQVIHNEPVAPRALNPAIDHDLETICLKCMAKEPNHRYSTARELSAELGRYLSGEPLHARPVGRIERGWRWCRRNPVWAGLCIAVVLAALSAAVTAVFVHRSGRLAQLATLQGSFENRLDQPVASREYLEEMERHVDEIAALNAPVARELRPRLYETFATRVHELIRQPRLTEEDVTKIESLLASLNGRSELDVARYRDELQRARHEWRTVVQIAPPFEALGGVFDEKDLVKLQEDSGGTPQLVVPESARKSPWRRTTIPSQGDIEVEVTFDDDWKSRQYLGVVLDGHRANEDSDVADYEFILRAAGTGHRQTLKDIPSFAAQQNQSTDYVIQVYRDGLLLRNATLPSAKVTDLSIRVRRSARRLSVQFGTEPPIGVDEIFVRPQIVGGGRVYVVDPVPESDGRSCIHTLVVRRRVAPSEPSPLSSGDQFFVQEKYREALDQYRAQRTEVTSGTFSSEARYKESLCLIELQRLDEATEHLEFLVDEQTEPWSILAACQMWLIHLRAKREDDADALLVGLASRYKFEDLAVLLPVNMINEIVEYYTRSLEGGYLSIRPDPKELEKLERTVAVYELLSASDAKILKYQTNLADALLARGLDARALSLMESSLRDYRGKDFVRISDALNAYACALVRANMPQKALAEINRRIPGNADVLDRQSAALLELRASVYATLGDWGKSSEDLKTYMSFLSETDVSSRAWADFDEGIVLEHLGQPEQAQAVWRAGFVRAKGAPQFTMHAAMPYAFMGSLTNQFDESDLLRCLSTATSAQLGAPLQAALQRKIFPHELISSIIRNTWQTPRGRAVVSNMFCIGREIRYRDSSEPPADVMAIGMEVVRRLVTGSADLSVQLSKEQEAVAEDMLQEMFAAYFDGRIGEQQLIQFGLAFKGVTNILGWKGLASRLPDEFRGAMAYVLGCHHMREGRYAAAKELLDAAEQDATAAPSVKVLAQQAKQELEKLAH
jgi:predicted Ser/Thr protein kinase